MSANSTSPSPAAIAAELQSLERNDYGPMLGTAFMSFALWGMICVQVYTYYNSELSKKDRMVMRAMVAIAAVTECFLTFLYAHIAFFYVIFNFGDPTKLVAHPWSLNVVFVVKEFEMFVIRCMFLRRLYLLSKSNWLITGWILLWSLFNLATGIVFTVQFFELGLILTYPRQLYITVYVAQAGLVCADVSLAAALCYYLHKSRTGFKRTDSIVRVFIIYSVNTTAIVVVAALISTALFLAAGATYLDFPFLAAQPKLYFIAYMVTVNNRENIRANREASQSIHFSSLNPASTDMNSHGGVILPLKRNFGNINVGTTTETFNETYTA